MNDLEVVYRCLDFEPRSVKQIQELCGIPVLKLMQLLLELELKGLAKEVMKSYYVKKN